MKIEKYRKVSEKLGNIRGRVEWGGRGITQSLYMG